MIIQIKATEPLLLVVLFIMLYQVFLTFKSVDEILWCEHSNVSYWAVLSCGTVHYAVQQGGSNFWVWSVDEILKCDHSNESYWAVLSCGAVHYAEQGVSQFESVESYWATVVLFISLYKVLLTFESVDEILWCDHSIESYWVVLSCGTIYHAIQAVQSFESVDEILFCDHSNESYWADKLGVTVDGGNPCLWSQVNE